ncbi:hypothetical protein RDWZM_002647, partial [Blomia tropicalis]
KAKTEMQEASNFCQTRIYDLAYFHMFPGRDPQTKTYCRINTHYRCEKSVKSTETTMRRRPCSVCCGNGGG